MKFIHIHTILIFLTLFVFTSCTPDSSTLTTIRGSIDYKGGAEMYIQLSPLHYKYSQKEQYPVQVRSGRFETQIDISAPQIIQLFLQDQSYPLYVEPGSDLDLTIERALFPQQLEVDHPEAHWNEAYNSFIQEVKGLDNAITAEMDKFKVGEENNALELSTRKLEAAEKHLKDTDFHPLYLKTIGEDLVLKLRGVEYSARHFDDYQVDEQRQEVVNEALEKDFFSLESLEAQRAGIRDFTHYYSRTFGIYDSVNSAYGTTLAEYDIKQVAYKELNEKRMQVIEYIDDDKARAYARMFLVAERIGEQPMELAEPTYEEYLRDYPEYEEYTEFLTYFYKEIKSVSPGQAAVSFSLPDRDGDIHTMEDYKGKYVLLDFWAGWCQPCLDEFEDMRRIYNSYSRDDFEIVGISTEVDSTTWIYDIERFENPWVQLYGGDGFDQKTFQAYKGGGIPFYILVDREGNIERYNDFRPTFNFEEILDSLIQSTGN